MVFDDFYWVAKLPYDKAQSATEIHHGVCGISKWRVVECKMHLVKTTTKDNLNEYV